jgi:hypothetical protein
VKKSPLKVTFYSIVPKAGLEPAQLAPHAPETCVSTNFTTSAFYYMVPRTGLEPAHLAALPPQSSVSTNFTTWAGYIKAIDNLHLILAFAWQAGKSIKVLKLYQCATAS